MFDSGMLSELEDSCIELEASLKMHKDNSKL